MRKLPLVVLLGRPNVGKSTLFNRLVGRREAIVADRPGVTVDRLERACDLGEGVRCLLVDTGGIGAGEREQLTAWIEREAEAALALADLVLLVVDAQAGPLPADEALADRLRRAQVPVLPVANKAENPDLAHAFHALGLGAPVAVSALHGHGIARLRARMRALLPSRGQAPEEAQEAHPPAICVIGRPNAGKSTLVNAWLGAPRVAAGPVPGTTRDAVDVRMEWEGRPLVLVDTAGQRRRARVRDEVEWAARVRTERALTRADAAVLLVDASDDDGASVQDVRLARTAWEAGCALVAALSKVDAVDEARLDEARARLAWRLRGFAVPTAEVSAKTGAGLEALLGLALGLAEKNRMRVPTGRLNRWLEGVQRRHPHPPVDGRPVRLKYAVQVGVRPPTFRVFANRPDAVRPAFARHLLRSFQEAFDARGVPARFVFAATGNPYRE